MSGRVWTTLADKDKALIQDLVRKALNAQIDEIVATEAGHVEKFKATGIPMKVEPASNVAASIAEFDKLWLAKAPAIAELRKAGASL